MSEDGLRLDLWLWRTRFFKTRTETRDFVSSKGVRIGRAGQIRRTSKPGASVHPGDTLTFSRNGKMVVLEIEALPERRGPASEAQEQYTLIEQDTGQ